MKAFNNLSPVVSNIVGSRDNHRYWFMTAAFAAVTLISLTSQFENWGDQGSSTKWSVVGVSFIMILATLSVVGHVFFVDKFADTKSEGGAAMVVCGIWATVLPVVMAPGNNLAVDSEGNILNANMYFFAWIGSFLSFVLLFRYVEHRLLRSNSNVTPDYQLRLSPWAGLTVTSFVVLVEAGRLLNNGGLQCGSATGIQAKRCTRTDYAIAISVLTVLIALAWICATRIAKMTVVSGHRINNALVFVMVALWTVGMLVITFGGDAAPATNLGNLYIFTWGSFCISVCMAIDAIKEARGGNDSTDGNDQDPTDGNDEESIENGEKINEHDKKQDEDRVEEAMEEEVTTEDANDLEKRKKGESETESEV